MKSIIHLASLLATASIASSTVVRTPSSEPGTFELLILHNNDMHARFEQTSQLSGACTTADREAGKCYGGFPRVAHVVKEARRAAASGEGPPVLYLNAGDTYTGTAWFTIYKWRIAAEFVNALQPDAVSLGNHEFDNGVSGLTPFIENLMCPVLACNLLLAKEPTLIVEQNLRNSVVFNVSGTQVAVIGYLTPETKVLAVKNKVEYTEEVIAIRKEIEKLKRRGDINIFIALGHSGWAKDLQIAKDVEDIDLVIGGHTNTFLWNGTAPDSEQPDGPYPTLVRQASGRIVPTVQAYAYTKYLGKLNLVFNSDGEMVSFDGKPILLNASIPQDPEVLGLLEKYRADVTLITETIVGNTSVVLDGKTCRVKECNMGNLITDAVVYKYASEYKGVDWTDAPIAVIQRGGIRSSISHVNLPSNITKGDLLIVLPFDGRTVKITMNGTNLLKMLEYSVFKYNPIQPPGSFLQMSGLKVEYDLKMPPGKRVANAEALCGKCTIPSYMPINKTMEYNVLMSSFLAGGGDGFDMFDGLPATALHFDELQATVVYIQTHSPIYPTVDGRIIIRNLDKLKVNSGSSITGSVLVGFATLLFTRLF